MAPSHAEIHNHLRDHRLLTPSHQRGFSIVELSIVLVIIALLIAGILLGQAIIKSAKLQKVTGEVKQHIVAVRLFQDRFGSLPGDMPNAQSFWPTTTNGNNDGMIRWDGTGGNPGEGPRFWQQLSLAGLEPVSYTGITVDDEAIPGINIPASSLRPNGGYYPYSDASLETLYNTRPANYIALGAQRSQSSPRNSYLIPVEALQLDDKMDNGDPHTGEVIGRNGKVAGSGADDVGCTSGTLPDIFYDAGESDPRCLIYFSFGPKNAGNPS